jgi:hypothetical protein
VALQIRTDDNVDLPHEISLPIIMDDDVDPRNGMPLQIRTDDNVDLPHEISLPITMDDNIGHAMTYPCK